MEALTAQLANVVLDDTVPINHAVCDDVTLEELIPSLVPTDKNNNNENARNVPAKLKKLYKSDFSLSHKVNVHLPQDVKLPKYSFSKKFEESEKIFARLSERFEIFVETTPLTVTLQNRAAVVKSHVTDILTRYSRWLKTLEPTSVSKFTEHTMNATLGSFICGASDIFDKHGYAFDYRYAGTYEKSEEPLISSTPTEGVKKEEVSKNLSLWKDKYSKVKWTFCDHTLYLRRLVSTVVYLRDISNNTWSRVTRNFYRVEDDCAIVQFEYKVGRFEYFKGLISTSTKPENMDESQFVNRVNKYALLEDLETKAASKGKKFYISDSGLKYKLDRIYPYEVVYNWNERCDFKGPIDYDVVINGQLTEAHQIAAVDALKRARFRGFNDTVEKLETFMRIAMDQLAGYRENKKNEIALIRNRKNTIFNGVPHLQPSDDGVFGEVSYLSVAVIMLNNDIVFKFID